MKQNVTDKAVKGIEGMKDVVREMAEQSNDVKEGNCTAEEKMKNDDGYILLNQIMESTSKMLQEDIVINVCNNLKKNLGESSAEDIMSLLSVLMTYSAHNAIMFYDELLCNKLEKQFGCINNNYLLLKSSSEAHEAVLKVHKKQLDEINSTLKLGKFKSDNNVE